MPLAHPHLESLSGVSRRALEAAFRSGSGPLLAVDATAGNGHDTLFLARCVGARGTVWAFDVQEAALRATSRRLANARDDTHAPETSLAARVRLVHAGHETLEAVLIPELQALPNREGTAIPAGSAGIHGATFNLGFLPGSDKQRTTVPSTTVRALESLVPLMAPGGIISVHCYTGHQGGRDEARAVEAFFASLPWDTWRVAVYGFHNKPKNKEALYLAARTP